MSMETDRLGQEAVTQGAEMGDASLAGIGGKGTLQVVRDQQREVIEILGTWHAGEEGADVSALDAAIDKGEPVEYRGLLDDPDENGTREVTLEVAISSHSEYTFDATSEEGESGPTLRVFNFHPTEEGRANSGV